MYLHNNKIIANSSQARVPTCILDILIALFGFLLVDPWPVEDAYALCRPRHDETLKRKVLLDELTMLEENLALTLGSQWVCSWFGLPQFESSLNVNLGALFE